MTTSLSTERNDVITFQGKPMTLVGPALAVGQAVPPFTLSAADLSAFTLDDATASGTRRALLIVVPSLDTPTCSVQTVTFHKRIREVPPDTTVLVVSRDLPFAQQRWSEANQASGLTYLSDYRDGSFGHDYGLAIKEMELLTRAVLIIGKDAKLSYLEVVPEIANEPNYDLAFAAL